MIFFVLVNRVNWSSGGRIQSGAIEEKTHVKQRALAVEFGELFLHHKREEGGVLALRVELLAVGGLLRVVRRILVRGGSTADRFGSGSCGLELGTMRNLRSGSRSLVRVAELHRVDAAGFLAAHKRGVAVSADLTGHALNEGHGFNFSHNVVFGNLAQ